MIAKLRLLSLPLVLLTGVASVRADLLIDPTGGYVVWDDSDSWTETSVVSDISLSGEFFGGAFSDQRPTISINGNINFSGDASGYGTLGSSSRSRIAPLWSNLGLYYGSGGSVVESVGQSYYAVTWLGLKPQPMDEGSYSFQGVFFTEATTINGIDFLANDIVFAYLDISATLLDFVSGELNIGLENPLGGVAVFGGGNGKFTQSTQDQIPVGAGEYILFRPDGLGGYNVSTTAIPEPAAFATLAGLGCLLMATSRRRARA